MPQKSVLLVNGEEMIFYQDNLTKTSLGIDCSSECTSYFFPLGFCGPLGGVTGRPEFRPPYWYFAFFSDGLRIYTTGKQ